MTGSPRGEGWGSAWAISPLIDLRYRGAMGIGGVFGTVFGDLAAHTIGLSGSHRARPLSHRRDLTPRRSRRDFYGWLLVRGPRRTRVGYSLRTVRRMAGTDPEGLDGCFRGQRAHQSLSD